MARHTPIVRDLLALIRTHRVNYQSFNNACHKARKEAGLKPSKRGRQLPKLLPQDAFDKYMNTVIDSGNLQHEILVKVLFFTAVRNAELCKLKITDIDFPGCRMFIDDGKGSKDRYVLFKENFKSLLRAYIQTLDSKQEYLFESQHKRHYSERRIQQIVKQYGVLSEIGFDVHPHLMRHQSLTWLKKHGIEDAQLQLISGHASRKSLEIYTHLSLGDVSPDYQEAMSETKI